MKLLEIRKMAPGKFITRYDLTYETASHGKKVYEIISRNKNLTTQAELADSPTDAVVIIATDKSGDRILLNREFRMAVGDWIYNFPAGLIDPGESPEVAAKRELWEETGLELVAIDDVLMNSYSAIGFCNEHNAVILGRAEGEFRPSTSEEEEIEAGWFTRDEIRKLLRTEKFAARTQGYCYLWSKEK